MTLVECPVPLTVSADSWYYVGYTATRAGELKQGVPQKEGGDGEGGGRGGLITNFIVFMKDSLQRLPKNVKGAMYADDLAILCSGII